MQKVAIKIRNGLSIKAQALATLIAIVFAVVLPQIFHAMGLVSGLGTALGEAFLPMHLPVLLLGFLVGPYAGAVAGLLSPLVSFALSGMPTYTMLPFMMIELCIYGFVSGMFKDKNMPTTLKVLITQISGRLVRAVAIVLATYAFSNTAVPVSIIWTSVLTGIFGIVLQLVLIPLILYRVKMVDKE